MTDEYVSIATFASMAGVTKQAIYARLDTSLKDYVKVVNGKKTLNIAAIKHFTKEESKDDVLHIVQDISVRLEELKTEIEKGQSIEKTFNETVLDAFNSVNKNFSYLTGVLTRIEENQNDVKNFMENISQKADASLNPIISNLQSQIDFLKSQLEEKDRQISNRDRQIEAMTALQAVSIQTKPEKIGFFKRLFS